MDQAAVIDALHDRVRDLDARVRAIEHAREGLHARRRQASGPTPIVCGLELALLKLGVAIAEKHAQPTRD